ncbi:MAG: CRTAC1 family protein [Saprospiraceae bacterium]|nr:CRTAC1 family protein [Saprospiraceae bacterium]
MITILDSVATHSDPQRCYSMNTQRAAYWQRQMNTGSPEQQVSARFSYAEQMLKAGNNEVAAMAFSELIRDAGDQLDERTKILYELLAMCYMRLGESANCIVTHTDMSCALPIRGDGVYRFTAGPENAILIYERILDRFPDDQQTRWLYNLALMTIGRWPQDARSKYRLPESIFASKKGMPELRDIAIEKKVDVRGISGGVSLEDYDQDGLIDIFASSNMFRDPLRFFRNNGDGTFSEKTAEANLTGIVGGLNLLHADYDNDGDPDLFVLRGGWLAGGTHPNSLLRNNGDGTFTDVTIAAGLLSFHPTQAGAWADYDGDGFLDLYIGNETYDLKDQHPCELYHNNGDGTFTNVAPALGLDYVSVFKAVHWGDINNDQRPDLYISNLLGENILLLNQGGTAPDKWVFRDITAQAGVGKPLSSFPAFFFDYNNDGWDDIFVAGYEANATIGGSIADLVNFYLGKPTAEDPMRIYRNEKNGQFTDQTRALNMETPTYAMGNNVGDIDNDGWPDIFLGTGLPDLRALVPNRLFKNIEGKRFEDVTMGRFGHIQKGHGIALADVDNDGDLDSYLVAGGAFEGDLSNNLLYQNAGNDNAFLTLELEGKQSNRCAIGAKIAVEVIDKKGASRYIYTTVNSGGTFGASALRRTIGLGKIERIASVTVLWPRPGVPNAVFRDVPAGGAFRVVEGQAELKPIVFPPVPM